ncbi:hypothetical protein FVEG_13643 [Fusarium verticillioides 7600]|uniref:Uncharacterized protein n=1 Tax=Gibberella moniliformis (strain M3125 / FGSC 7600) TaxID=334819 RepID=W7N7G6_GIBM7|nr:hypothetical protein FVEG_13643 [Fusarium verticillioides 7600]EWG55674.1 hypothetical protein FVEG_13643 [Fusarium verticillioides 7600]RBQ71041.1 hypothetical protein FVER14953_13643 [Fusarium verticillioides]RBQ89665.1 hypothetical protein FVER53263_13643 [Fusarium verticillioides]RBR09859.1 hypothetical protein FVER53590_13643 [Fusarium verticillioides]
MLVQSLSRAAIVATLCLAGLTSAVRESGDPSPAISKSTSTTTARAHERKKGHREDKVMVSCAGHITQCGVKDKAKIVYVPVSTSTVTNTIVKTDVVTLPTSVRVIEKVRVETVTNTTMGHCRETLTVTGDAVTVAVDVVFVTTEEIQPISNRTTWRVTTVTASAIEQCFLEKYTMLAQGSASQGGPAEAIPIPSSDNVSPAASVPAASDESRPADDPAQRPLDSDDDHPLMVGSDGDSVE